MASRIDPASEDAGRAWPEGQVTEGFRPCALIPTYDNPRTLRAVVEQVRAYLPAVVVVAVQVRHPEFQVIPAVYQCSTM